MKPIKGFSFYMVPFCLTEYDYSKNADFSQLLDPDIWVPAEMKIENDVFYPYIQSFLQSSVLCTSTVEKKLQPHDYRIYSVNTVNNKLLHIIFNSVMFAQLKKNNDLRKIHFSLLNHSSNFLSTKLIICPNASVGIIMFALEIKDKGYTLKDFMDLNYFLHKTGSQLTDLYWKEQADLQSFVIKCNQETLEMSNAAEIIANKRKRLDERFRILEPILNPSKFARLEKDFSDVKEDTLGVENLTAIQDEDSPKVNEVRSWNLDNLFSVLLGGILTPTQRFNKNRCHVFSYLQLPPCEFDTELKADFIRIYRCENEKYLVMEDDMSSFQQTFKNIYVGCSVEGGALLTITPKKNASFIEQFWAASLQQRYLWMYLMVFIQRHTLLFMLHRLTMVDNYYSTSTKDSLKRLRELIKRLAELKVNTNFTDISDYTQHNVYYRFCSQQLGIETFFQEIDQKMTTLNNHLNQLSNKKKEDNEEGFAIFLAILTVASASNDGIDTMIKLKILDPSNEWFVTAGSIFVLSMLVYILAHVIFRIMKG